MEATDQIAIWSLINGAVVLVVAAAAFLVRGTRGVSGRRRIGAMAALAWSSAFGRIVIVVAAGLGGFLISGFITASICYGLLRWYASSLPVYAEAYEGFGDGMKVVFLAFAGLGFSATVGAICGWIVALRVHDKLLRRTL